MKITPYTSVDSLAFGMDEASTISLLGAPLRTFNRKGERQLFYGSAGYWFAEGTGLVECSVECQHVILEEVTIATRWLPEFTLKNDPNAKRVSGGFVVSPLFGIAIDLEHLGFVTAFISGRWDKYLSQPKIIPN